MKRWTLSVFALAAFGLAACGGGGSGDGGRKELQLNTGIQGTMLVLDGNTQATHSAAKETAKTENTAVLVVDGEKLTVYYPEKGTDIVDFADQGKSYLVSGSKYQDVRFGYVGNLSGGTKDVLFVQGDLAKSMPVSGKATYIGDAVVVEDGAREAGKSRFAVDFAAKTLSGMVSAGPVLDETKAIRLQASISGNQFSGTANGFSTQGAFYGNEAAELGGVYRSDDGKRSGAYGAVLQK